MSDKRSPTIEGPLLVLDDDSFARDLLSTRARTSSLAVIEQAASSGSALEIATDIARNARCAVLDHKLDGPHTGAEISAALTSLHVPSLVVTQWRDEAIETSRHFLDQVPKIISRRDFETNSVIGLLLDAAKRMRLDLRERQPYRTFVEVQDVYGDAMDVIVSAWDPNTTITMSTEGVPAAARAFLSPGRLLVGYCNLHAESPNELYVTRLKVAPAPIPEESFEG